MDIIPVWMPVCNPAERLPRNSPHQIAVNKLCDVAKLAGVSTATVSYVLNGSRSMSDKTKKIVMGAVSAFEDAGLRVPADVSVMGFDDILFARAWRPAITTMAVSKYEIGRKAFELLYTNIKKGHTGYYLSRLELKARASTGICK